MDAAGYWLHVLAIIYVLSLVTGMYCRNRDATSGCWVSAPKFFLSGRLIHDREARLKADLNICTAYKGGFSYRCGGYFTVASH